MKRMCMLLAPLAVAAVAGTANAGVTNLSGGWRANWDPSLDPYVNIEDLGTFVTTDDSGNQVVAQRIRKTAEFTLAPPFPGFPFPTIPINFTQTEAGAAEFIVIEEEVVTNSTGLDWYDFHFQLLGGNDVVFDPARTAQSGPDGFDVSPFTVSSFDVTGQAFDLEGGSIPAGGVWTPGMGPDGGALWIDPVVGSGEPGSHFTTFQLKETPTVPSPASVALFGLGAAAFVGRKRG